MRDRQFQDPKTSKPLTTSESFDLLMKKVNKLEKRITVLEKTLQIKPKP